MSGSMATVLDLGDTKVVCLAAELDRYQDLNVLALSSVECKGLKKGVITDIDRVAEAIRDAVKNVEDSTGRRAGPLVVSISGAHLEGVETKGMIPIVPAGRAITREDVLQVISHSRQNLLPPDREQIQTLPREFSVDDKSGVTLPIGQHGRQLTVTNTMITGQLTAVKTLERAVELAGQSVSSIVHAGLASGFGVLNQDERKTGAAVIDIGGGTTDVAVFAGGGLVHIASIPIGGQLVTKDIGSLLRTSPEEAERLKDHFGHAIPDSVDDEESVSVLQVGQATMRPMQRRVLCEIIESRMRELALYINGHLEKAGRGAKAAKNNIVLTGGGSLLPGVPELFSGILGVKVRLGGDFEIDPAKVTGKRLPGQSLSTALGLARFELQREGTDLAPAVPQAASEWRAKVRLLWSLLAGK